MTEFIPLTQYEFYGMVFGWVLAIIFGLIFFLMIKFTPAKEFLKAYFKKTPVARLIYPTGFTEFRPADDSAPGSLNVKGLGFVSTEKGSNTLEKKGKVVIYDVFTEYGVSIPKEYAPIINILRNEGFTINTFKDYKKIIDIANFYQEIKQGLEDKINNPKFLFKKKLQKELEELERMKAKIDEIDDKDKLSIKHYQTYKIHELTNMFPNGISPVTVEQKVMVEVARRRKKDQFMAQMWITGAIATFILIIAVIVLFKSGILDGGTVANTISQTTNAGNALNLG